jgi:hypothetical protein
MAPAQVGPGRVNLPAHPGPTGPQGDGGAIGPKGDPGPTGLRGEPGYDAAQLRDTRRNVLPVVTADVGQVIA